MCNNFWYLFYLPKTNKQTHNNNNTTFPVSFSHPLPWRETLSPSSQLVFSTNILDSPEQKLKHGVRQPERLRKVSLDNPRLQAGVATRRDWELSAIKGVSEHLVGKADGNKDPCARRRPLLLSLRGLPHFPNPVQLRAERLVTVISGLPVEMVCANPCQSDREGTYLPCGVCACVCVRACVHRTVRCKGSKTSENDKGTW